MPVLLCLLCFSFQQLLLPFQSPAITTKAFVLANYAVTWNHQRNRICSAGTCNCARCFFLTNRPGDFTVGMRLAVWNRSQLFPNLSLKSRGLNIKWQIDVWTPFFQVIHDRLD